MNTGIFYGIGVGPGVPELMTLRAVEVLKQADAVCIPCSGPANDSVALKIAGNYIHSSAEIISISTPMTRDKQILEREWQTGADTIAEQLRNGKNVAFITLGDAMLFSTYTYLLDRVRLLIPDIVVESIPGVTSFSAAAAHLNIALAEGSERLAIIPAIDDPIELKTIFNCFANVVLMKVAGKYEKILDVLTEMGLKDKAVYISRLGYEDGFVTYDLESMRNQKREYLSLIIVKREGFSCRYIL